MVGARCGVLLAIRVHRGPWSPAAVVCSRSYRGGLQRAGLSVGKISRTMWGAFSVYIKLFPTYVLWGIACIAQHVTHHQQHAHCHHCLPPFCAC